MDSQDGERNRRKAVMVPPKMQGEDLLNKIFADTTAIFRRVPLKVIMFVVERYIDVILDQVYERMKGERLVRRLNMKQTTELAVLLRVTVDMLHLKLEMLWNKKDIEKQMGLVNLPTTEMVIDRACLVLDSFPKEWDVSFVDRGRHLVSQLLAWDLLSIGFEGNLLGVYGEKLGKAFGTNVESVNKKMIILLKNGENNEKYRIQKRMKLSIDQYSFGSKLLNPGLTTDDMIDKAVEHMAGLQESVLEYNRAAIAKKLFAEIIKNGETDVLDHMQIEKLAPYLGKETQLIQSQFKKMLKHSLNCEKCGNLKQKLGTDDKDDDEDDLLSSIKNSPRKAAQKTTSSSNVKRDALQSGVMNQFHTMGSSLLAGSTFQSSTSCQKLFNQNHGSVQNDLTLSMFQPSNLNQVTMLPTSQMFPKNGFQNPFNGCSLLRPPTNQPLLPQPANLNLNQLSQKSISKMTTYGTGVTSFESLTNMFNMSLQQQQPIGTGNPLLWAPPTFSNTPGPNKLQRASAKPKLHQMLAPYPTSCKKNLATRVTNHNHLQNSHLNFGKIPEIKISTQNIDHVDKKTIPMAECRQIVTTSRSDPLEHTILNLLHDYYFKENENHSLLKNPQSDRASAIEMVWIQNGDVSVIFNINHPQFKSSLKFYEEQHYENQKRMKFAVPNRDAGVKQDTIGLTKLLNKNTPRSSSTNTEAPISEAPVSKQVIRVITLKKWNAIVNGGFERTAEEWAINFFANTHRTLGIPEDSSNEYRELGPIKVVSSPIELVKMGEYFVLYVVNMDHPTVNGSIEPTTVYFQKRSMQALSTQEVSTETLMAQSGKNEQGSSTGQGAGTSSGSTSFPYPFFKF